LVILSGIAAGAGGLDYHTVDWLHNHTVPYSIPFLQFISSANTYVSLGVTLIILVLSLIKKSADLRKKFFALAIVLVLVSLTSQGLK
jgi:hypothetical protein